MFEKHWYSRSGAIACLGISLMSAGCTSMGDPAIGGRPLLYKNATSDEVEVKAGVVRKRADIDEERAAARTAPQPQPARRDHPPTTVAAAQPQARGAAASPDTDFFNRYTQASRYGDLLFVSGQIAVDPRNGNFDASQDVDAQTRRVLENIQSILEANRLTMANVVSTTVYIASISRLAAMDAVYHDYFRGAPPARTVVEVSNLPRGALVEISVVAGR